MRISARYLDNLVSTERAGRVENVRHLVQPVSVKEFGSIELDQVRARVGVSDALSFMLSHAEPIDGLRSRRFEVELKWIGSSIGIPRDLMASGISRNTRDRSSRHVKNKQIAFWFQGGNREFLPDGYRVPVPVHDGRPG